MNKVKFLVAALLGVLFVACSEEENLSQTSKTGFLVSLAEDVKVESRSTPEELGEPVASQFNLKITNQVTGSELYNGSYTSDLIQASAGTYAIEATHGENQLLAVDAPYYKGTAEAELADGESKTVNVKCKVANALASVVFSDGGALKFEDQFSECELNVLVAGDRALIDGVKSAYYRAGSTPTFEFRGILKDGGEEVVQTLTDDKFSDPATFAAGAHCVITLKIGAVEPGVKIEISKVEVNEVTVSETIPMKWLPKPKVTATGFDSNNTLAFVETEQKQAALNLDLSSALQDIKFKFNFEDEQFASLEKEKEYLLSTDKATIEQALGITLPSVGDKPESIDLKGLIAKLQTNAGVPTNNSIEIDVQANNRWSSDAIEGESTPNLTYTLTCNKPEFTVDAYPGNIWTKEFTVNALREEQVTSGDFTKLSSDMTYQYSADGQTGWTNLSDGMRQDQLQSGTTYYIRGLYRGAVPGEVAEVSTYPETPLEYGDMEEWNTITKKLCVGTNVFNWRDVYGNSPNNNIWACVNAKTFEGDPNVYSTFNLNPSTYSVEGRSGKAAALRTVGWDNNWGNTSSLIRHIAAGKLFIGKYSFVHEDGPETYDYGMSYSSRPTSVEFYYTYSPYNGDSFKVWVVLENRSNDGNVTRIGYGELTGSESITSFTHNTISIEYSNIYLDITHMYIVFSSSANCSDVEETENNNLQGMVSEGNYHNGSVLTIDDVQLIYEK
ncbi:MAG: DUF4493 domain-containing protein [Candidatus Phocaeicola faecipullorum]|nr:DUF4493 domain-containing protein [Candidatus Phocaeicola faecipullorum]